MKYSQISDLNIDNSVKSQLSYTMRTVREGKDDVLISPLAKDKDPQKILEAWDSVVKKHQSVLNERLLKLEHDNRSKFGPRSIAIPWEDRRDGVLSYFAPYTGRKFQRTVSKKSNRVLRPKSIQEAAKLLKNNTNSGLPFFTRKGKIKDIGLQNYQYLIDQKYPCVLFTRTQEQKKTRPVWGYPWADTLREMRYYAPLLAYQKTTSWRSSLLGPDVVNAKVSSLIDKGMARDHFILSIDFSAYDASLKPYLQSEAFKYVKSLYQPSYHQEIDEIAERMATIGLITPDGILEGNHGVPSGSTFTNEVDSIVQFLIATEYGIDPRDCDIQGDDGVYIVPHPEPFKDHFRQYGLVIQDDKSDLAKNYALYLQCLYHEDYRGKNGIIPGIYPTYRALNRIIYPERFTDLEKIGISGRDYFAIRTICILENCKHHPLFEELIRFIYELDKYRLDFTEQGLRAYVKSIYESSGTQGILKYREEDDVTGIMMFETVKILRGLK